MGTLAGLATTYDLPNYGGELVLVTPADTPFLSAIGGLSADDADLVVAATEFTWQTEDLAAAAQPANLEGAAPTIEERTRSSFSNVVQIFQYGVEVSYSKLVARQQLANLGNGSTNPVQDELDHQIELKLKTAARDVNYSFINGAYQKPANNLTARKTRGLLAASPGVRVWDGAAWATVGGGVNGRVNALVWFAGKLYVGGQFTQAGGSVTVSNVAAWTGAAWDTLSGGRGQVVNALAFAVYDGAIKLALGLESSPYFAVYFPADLYWETAYVDSLDGAVKAIVPDARGGFYVAGAFNNSGSLAVGGVL